jgi:hypothetical protein
MLAHLWKQKWFWDYAEIILVCLTAVSAAFTAATVQDHKRIPASLTACFALSTALSKWRSKRIEAAERRVKAAQDDSLQSQHRGALARLEREAEDYRLKYNASVRHLVTAILDDFHSKYFRRDVRTEDKYKHRATLFVCTEPPGASGQEKLLTVFARSGVYKESRCSWPIDDNHPQRCRGVAGQIWFHGVGRVRTARCDWPDDGDPAQKAVYAESLGMSVDEAEALNVKSKVFTGAQIMVRGQKWGVLLLDSLKEGSIVDGPYEKQVLSQYVDMISSILTKILP